MHALSSRQSFFSSFLASTLFKLLLSQGASLDCESLFGETPQEVALQNAAGFAGVDTSGILAAIDSIGSPEARGRKERLDVAAALQSITKQLAVLEVAAVGILLAIAIALVRRDRL